MPASWQDLARQYIPRHRTEGDNLRVCCPFHDDDNPSATMYESGVMVCHACKTSFSPFKWADRVGIPKDTWPEQPRSEQSNRPVAEYIYRDAEANDVLKVLRFELPDGKKTFKQQRFASGRWIWGLEDKVTGQKCPRYPYQLDLIHMAPAWDPIVWVEGEKDALTASKLGHLATTTPGGAANFHHVDKPSLQIFAGRTVILIPDNDAEGERYVHAVAAQLAPLGADLKLCRLPEVGLKGDLTDWLRQGNTPKDLAALLDRAPAYLPPTREEIDPEDPSRFEDPREALLGPQDPVPNFPLEIFPGWLGEFARQVAIETQTMPAAAGFLALGALATACQKKFRVEVFGSWWEPVNLYLCTAMESGDRKSAVFRHFQEPIHEWEAQERERLALDLQTRDYERHRLQKKIDAIKDAKKDNETDKHVLRDLVAELHKLPELKRPIWFADDATPEALMELLASSGERISLYSPEGGLFTMVGGRYSSRGQSNLDIYLKAYSEEWVRSHRRTKAAVELERPLLTISVMVQPEVLTATAAREDFRRSGFLGRFLWSIPGSFVGHRRINPPTIENQTAANYRTGIRALLRIPERKKATPIPLSDEARQIFDTFRTWVEEHLSGLHAVTERDLSAMAEWGQKLAGNTARIAALLHLATCAPGWSCLEEGADPRKSLPPIGQKTMQSACHFAMEFLVPHAQAVFYDLLKIGNRPAKDAPLEPKRGDLTQFIAYLENRAAQKPDWTFTKQQIWQAQKHRFPDSFSFRAVFEKLFEHGWFSIVEPSQKPNGDGRGRPTAPRFCMAKRTAQPEYLGFLGEPPYTLISKDLLLHDDKPSNGSHNGADLPSPLGKSMGAIYSSIVNHPLNHPKYLETASLGHSGPVVSNEVFPLETPLKIPNHLLGGPPNKHEEAEEGETDPARRGDPIGDINPEDILI